MLTDVNGSAGACWAIVELDYLMFLDVGKCFLTCLPNSRLNLPPSDSDGGRFLSRICVKHTINTRMYPTLDPPHGEEKAGKNVRTCNPQTICLPCASVLWSVISDDDVPVPTPIADVPNSCYRKMNEARTKDVRKTRMHSTNARLSSSPASPYVTRRRYNASGRTWTHAAALLAPHPETFYYYKRQTG